MLARYWLDVQKARFGSFRGIVRFTGRLSYLDPTHAKRNPGVSLLEILEGEIRRISGVKRVHFDLENWRRNGAGEWECSDAGSSKVGGGQSSGQSKTTMILEHVSERDADGDGSEGKA